MLEAYDRKIDILIAENRKLATRIEQLENISRPRAKTFSLKKTNFNTKSIKEATDANITEDRHRREVKEDEVIHNRNEQEKGNQDWQT
jgi:hypothetical protein